MCVCICMVNMRGVRVHTCNLACVHVYPCACVNFYVCGVNVCVCVYVYVYAYARAHAVCVCVAMCIDVHLCVRACGLVCVRARALNMLACI